MTGISTLGAALDQIERIKHQQTMFSTLSIQMTTGKKTQSFTGLGVDVLVSKRSRAAAQSIETYVSNIDSANRRISLTTAAIEQFKQQAKLFSNLLAGLPQEGTHQKGEIIYYDDPLTDEIENTPVGQTSADLSTDMTALQDLAGKILQTLTEILNTKEGDRYLLGGAESDSRPFESSSSLDSALNVLVNGWKNGAITTANFIADLQDRTTDGGNANALTDTIVGYSANLSSGNAGDVFVRTGENTEIEYTALANEQAFRDIIVAAAYIKNPDFMPMVDVYEPPNTYPGVPDHEGAPGATFDEKKENFYAVFNQLTTMVKNAITDIDAVSYRLANAQARIQQIKLDYGEQKNLLKSTIADIADVDTNEVAVRLTSLQTQLEASFQVTAITQQLTLANYLAFN
ncbi:MAG: flagellin [Alphaproteobacteria bacterium]